MAPRESSTLLHWNKFRQQFQQTIKYQYTAFHFHGMKTFSMNDKTHSKWNRITREMSARIERHTTQQSIHYVDHHAIYSTNMHY